MNQALSPAIIEALSIGNLPDVEWLHGDDLCDCTFQRIGMWKNVYLAQTLEIRLCCVWAELAKQYPQFFREIPGYWDENTGEWITEPQPWNGEDDMPQALFNRQIARLHDVTVASARAMELPAPKGRPIQPKHVFYLPWAGEYMPVELGR